MLTVRQRRAKQRRDDAEIQKQSEREKKDIRTKAAVIDVVHRKCSIRKAAEREGVNRRHLTNVLQNMVDACTYTDTTHTHMPMDIGDIGIHTDKNTDNKQTDVVSVYDKHSCTQGIHRVLNADLVDLYDTELMSSALSSTDGRVVVTLPKRGKPQKMSEEYENALASWIILNTRANQSITVKQATVVAQQLLLLQGMHCAVHIYMHNVFVVDMCVVHTDAHVYAIRFVHACMCGYCLIYVCLYTHRV